MRATWRYHGITATRLHDDLAGLPAKIEQIEELAGAGVIGGEQPNAADLQIGATIRVLLPIEDLGPLLQGTAAERIALSLFSELSGHGAGGRLPGRLGTDRRLALPAARRDKLAVSG